MSERGRETPRCFRTGRSLRREREQLRSQFLLSAPELATARGEIDTLRRSPPRPRTTLVMAERPPQNPRPTFLRTAASICSRRNASSRRSFPLLPPLPPGVRRDRLAFARWLVSPENPLTARVTVNREWAAIFRPGIGQDDRGFRLPGRSAESSGTARLARGRIREGGAGRGSGCTGSS